MTFDPSVFTDDLVDPEKTTLADFKEDPKATLASYGLTITEEQSAFLKLATKAGEAVPDLDIIAVPIVDF